ncbi:hypothetical protein E2L08_08780 [Palleronia sediminis]|uniref:Uncharacterized protein n=1 Tax=Palleronia sediminis TaxID=2547833 RepID=A0A4R6A7N4_9RHOB|nr:hypothetical protein [Palleronia sediminis]TDL79690.1 hypothetical protein E2L08_08780 [Palleronia sediminis]
MTTLIWIGTALSAAGLAGLVFCIVSAMRLRRAGLDDAALRARLRGLVAWNLGALMLSMLGLMVVIVGILIG